MSDPPEKEALPARKVRKATPALPDLPEQQAPPGRKASREYKVDPNGDLYAVYADTTTASAAPVSYDPATGDLYYMINDGK